MATFKDLNAPIYVRIMRFLPSLQAILFMAASCRPALQAFEKNEAIVLCQYLLDLFDYNLYDAFNIVRGPVFNPRDDWFPFGPENAKYSIWSWRVQVFAERAVATSPRVRDEVITTWLRRQLVPGTYDRHLVVSLCRLATTVDALLGQYWGFAQGIAHGQVPVLALEAPLGRPGTRSGADFPSRSERHRLVRAFLRYEFMCRMFSIPYWKILTYTAMKKDLSPGQAIARLESFAKNDFNTEGFLLLLEEDDAEQTLSVGAFVRAQWRAILSWARQLFENNAMAASQRLAMAAAETLANSDDEPFPLSFFLDTTMTSDDENTEFNLQYLFGRPQASVTSTSGQVNELEATWIDNVAAGFGLVLLKRVLEADDTTRRVHLQTLVTVVDPSSTALERTTGYKPIFMHTRSFPVLPHNAPNKGKIVLKSKGGDVSSGSNSNKKPAGLDKAKMRSLGYHFWDLSRLETPLYRGLKAGWLTIPTPRPHEPAALEQLHPGPAWTSATVPYTRYESLAKHVWAMKYQEKEGRISLPRAQKLVMVLKEVTDEAGY